MIVNDGIVEQLNVEQPGRVQGQQRRLPARVSSDAPERTLARVQHRGRSGSRCSPAAARIVADLDQLYSASVDRLQAALTAYLADGTRPDPAARRDGSFAYPEIRVEYRGGDDRPTPMRSFGRLVSPGDLPDLASPSPQLFADYLTEQLTLLIEDYGVEVTAGLSRQEIPFPYVLDPGHALSLDAGLRRRTGPPLPGDRTPADRRRGRGRYLDFAGRDTAAGAVRRAANRLQPRAATPLYRHAVRAHATLRAVHQLSPLRRRIRPLGRVAAGRRQAASRACRARAG